MLDYVMKREIINKNYIKSNSYGQKSCNSNEIYTKIKKYIVIFCWIW